MNIFKKLFKSRETVVEYSGAWVGEEMRKAILEGMGLVTCPYCYSPNHRRIEPIALVPGKWYGYTLHRLCRGCGGRWS